ncbi:MAG: proteasome accessory factor PafA2 [Actinobacteria bacterium]|nr:proteasome accessory factor PafA2 [Actinomycetota bacterium]
MAIVKVCGIETEYGILLRGSGESNPIAASSVLINAYVQDLQQSPVPGGERIEWDFEDESPGNDARGFAREGAMPPEVETHLVNTVLTNGARYYVDHAHPEFSTPECADALEVVRFDRAGEVILARSIDAAARSLPTGQGIFIYKNNSDGKGNSYGCHENYMMDRAVPFGRIVRHVMPHFVTRQIYCGAGKVGCETASPNDKKVTFQLSQRADFFEEEVGLETTLKRPIVNTRDEPHADAQKYRRLHVIVGDANMSEVSTLLKVGTTAIVLAMIEDDWFGERELSLATPVQAIRRISHDLTLSEPMTMANGSTMTAIEIQWELLDLARKYAEDRGLECVNQAVGTDVLQRWEAALSALETDPSTQAGQVDWVAKYRLLEGYRDRHGLDWDDHRLAAMDLQYHDVRPEKSLAARVGLERVTTDAGVIEAITEPPRDTRAYFRGKCLQKWAGSVAAANWDSLVFDLGSDPLRRVPMMEPLKGTAEFVDRLLEECQTPAELIERLGS